MDDAKTSQRIEQKKLELVEALAGVIAPLDEILSEHQAAQNRLQSIAVRLRMISRIMFVGCTIGIVLIILVGYSLFVQLKLKSAQEEVLAETLRQKALISKQASKEDVDTVSRKIDQQPRFKVRAPASSDPTGSPVVVIETPPVASGSASPARSAERVEIPIDLRPNKK